MSKTALYLWLIILLAIIGVTISYLPEYYHNMEPWAAKDAIAWGIMVPTYAYFALIATGASTVNSLYTVFGYKGPKNVFEKIIKHAIWLSLISLIPAWTPILLDLGRLDHFTAMLLSFNYESRIAWMGVLYVFFAIMVLIELIHHIREDAHEPGKLEKAGALGLTISLLTLLADLLLDGNLGAVFGSSTAVPAWSGAYVSVLFVVMAIFMGAAWLTIYLPILYASMGKEVNGLNEFIAKTYGKIIMIVTLAVGFIIGWEAITSYDYPARWEYFHIVFHGSLSGYFWWFVVGLGIVLPFFLAAWGYVKNNMGPTYIAAILSAVSGYLFVYTFVIGGQLARISFDYGGLTNNFNPYHVRFYPYHFTLDRVEVFLVAFSVSLWAFLVTIGEMILPLEKGEKPKHLWIFK